MLNSLSDNSFNEVFLHNISLGVCQIGQAYDAPFSFLFFLEWSRGINLLSILCGRKLKLGGATEIQNCGERTRAGLRKYMLMG